MNSLPYIFGAFALGAAMVWTSYDAREQEQIQEARYKDMVCLHRADLRMGKKTVEARGWPNYKGIKVECNQ